MHRHLSIRDRVVLQYTLENLKDISCASLAREIGCHPSTIYRELKRHALKRMSKAELFLQSAPRVCSKLDRFPFVCNPCRHKSGCSKRMLTYDAYEADRQANHSLRDTRSHPSLSSERIRELNLKVTPLVQAHQSLYHIIESNPSLPVSESTLRRYIDKRILDAQNIDLPRTVRFPCPKATKRVQRKRINVNVLVNRTYQDYLDYTATKPRVTLQLDSVIGKTNDAKCLLTLYETRSRFQWGYIVYKSALDVNAKLSALLRCLQETNHLFFDCFLTDNGGEFQSLPTLETTQEGEVLCRVFFCDPYASFQKGGCERNHSLIRYVIKKGESFDYSSQDEINLLFSHINSLKRRSLSGKSPFQRFTELFHFSPSDFVNISEIAPPKLILKK